MFAMLFGATTTLMGFFGTPAFADVVPPAIIRPYDEVACNCYMQVKVSIPSLPLMAEVIPNSTPHEGAVVIFEYTDKETGLPVKHIAIMGEFDDMGFWIHESNFKKCEYGTRYILWTDEHLRGFGVY